MQYHIIRMNFNAPIHLGNREGVLESTLNHVPSDMLFSAFCNVYRLIYGKNVLEQMISGPVETIPAFSSAFPFLEQIYFLPRPLDLDMPGWEPKQAKRLRYIEHKLFCKYLEGQLGECDLQGYLREANAGFLLPPAYEKRKLYQEEEVPRVALDSIGSNSNVYYFNQLRFFPGSGLYCLVRCTDELWPLLQGCWRVLGDEGLGGDRSSGKGSFQVEFPGEMEFPEITQPGATVLLGLYYPTAEESTNLESSYSLVQRAGYIYSPDEYNQRRQTVRMLAEGSVIYEPPTLTGQMVDVTPPGFAAHRVWRDGRAFTVSAAGGKGAI